MSLPGAAAAEVRLSPPCFIKLRELSVSLYFAVGEQIGHDRAEEKSMFIPLRPWRELKVTNTTKQTTSLLLPHGLQLSVWERSIRLLLQQPGTAFCYH